MSSGVKVTDIAYVRLQSPDLEAAERFLTDFGMVRTHKSAEALYMRATGPAPYVHITHRGPAKVLGFGFLAAREADLKQLASLGQSGIEHIDEPGEGKRVRLRDPLGYAVEIVWGIRPMDPLPVTPQRIGQSGHRGRSHRSRPGPAQVKRIAHAVYNATAPTQSRAWYRSTLGLLCSDEIYLGSKENVIASFDRCNRGAVPVDHHTVLISKGPRNGLNHVCFEVQSIDDLMLGHDHLKRTTKYRHVCGVGRHSTSSQVFDYWKDPWDRIHEHYADGDLLDASVEPKLIALEDVRVGQWGPDLPKEMVEHAVS